MDTNREVDEEHMLIHWDDPEERGKIASLPDIQTVSGTVDEAWSQQQMALIAWKYWGGGQKGGSEGVRQGSLSLLPASHGTSTLPFYPVLLVGKQTGGMVSLVLCWAVFCSHKLLQSGRHSSFIKSDSRVWESLLWNCFDISPIELWIHTCAFVLTSRSSAQYYKKFLVLCRVPKHVWIE